ncbi:MAG TPA: serine/threonine protein kinase, partial [Planctomycetaceae bacterium]|nr:serine/threonine protein kinase [Planctomycetaceae bacterium]
MAESREEQLGEVLEQYLSARRAGKRLERDELLRRHPELAAELEECLDSLEFLAATLSLEGPAGVLAPGQEFADYEIVREIARGGMGVVYEAFHLGLERRVALKVLSGAGLDELRNRERFLREAKTAAGLHHTNIVPIFEVSELGEVCYYAMQFIEGRSLSELIKEERSRGELPSVGQIGQFVDFAAQAAEALAYAHRRGVVHRDIKPSNLLV